MGLSTFPEPTEFTNGVTVVGGLATDSVTVAGVPVNPDGNTTVTGDLTVSGKVGFNGLAKVGLSSAYTKTYSTQARTIPAATAASVATTGSTNTTPYGYGSAAQADAIPVAINALEADVLALKKLIVALVVDLQAVGIAG